MTREAAQKRNAKAFGVNSAVAMRKKFNVSQDRKNNKEFIPVVKNQSDEPPPLIVALVGPPKVGKSTLIRSLIKVCVSDFEINLSIDDYDRLAFG